MEIVSFLFDLMTPLLSAGAFSAVAASGVLLWGRVRSKSATQAKAIEASVENPVSKGWKALEVSYNDLSDTYANMEMDFSLAFPRSEFYQSLKATSAQEFRAQIDNLAPDIMAYHQLDDGKKKSAKETELLRVVQDIQSRLNYELVAASERKSRLSTYITQRAENKEKSLKRCEEIESMLGRRAELEERYDKVYLRDFPQLSHKIRTHMSATIAVINENDGIYLNKKDDIRKLNEAERDIKEAHSALKDYLHKLENYGESIMGATAGYRKVIEKIEPVNTKEVRILEAAHLALYKAETHEYSRGNPEKEYEEILTPVYEAIALMNKWGDGADNPKAAA